MEQDDGAGVDAGEEFGEGFLLGRLLLLNPVYVGETPEEGGVAKFLGHGKVGGAVDAAGRAVEFYHGFSGKFLVESFHLAQLFLEGFL